MATGKSSKRPAWPDRFLAALRNTGTVTAAARRAGVSRSAVYAEMATDPEFKLGVERVKEECVELVEQTLFESALNPNPANARDRALFLRAAKPAIYAHRLSEHQVREIREQTRREALKEVQDQLALLPPEPRKIVMAALTEVAVKQLPAPTEA